MVNKKNLYGILALALVFGMAAAGCEHNARGGEGGGNEPQLIDGYYGVTEKGETIEVILTLSKAAKAVVSGTFVIKINGVVVSSGNYENDNGKTTLTATDGSTVKIELDDKLSLKSIEVKKADGTEYKGSTYESKDYYYVNTILTKCTKDELAAFVSGKTIGEFADTFQQDDRFPTEEGDESLEVSWDYFVEIFTAFDHPTSFFTNITSMLNKDTLFVWDWVEKTPKEKEMEEEKYSDYPNFIMFVSRVPLQALLTCKF
ncbi:MAG: hypothetical protein LBK66_04740 [Spirochaetaceae bacterium]|jgi:hypothetical protein|nr:hypothetical protein [Spirochaetaceae bacterium]